MAGEGCLAETAFLEEALGEVVEREKTPEFLPIPCFPACGNQENGATRCLTTIGSKNLLDYPEVLLTGQEKKRKFWRSLGPYSSGYVGPAAPRPIPAGRVELPLRIDPDLVPPPEFEVLESRARERRR